MKGEMNAAIRWIPVIFPVRTGLFVGAGLRVSGVIRGGVLPFRAIAYRA
jgi:hypothetical protein